MLISPRRLYAAWPRPNCEKISVQSIPPIRPPTWPPIEIPETAKLSTRLIMISASAEPPSTKLRCRSRINAAPSRPKSAPEAPTVGAGGVQVAHSRRAGQGRDDVEHDEAATPERLLDRRADEPEEVHVEGDVDQVRVQEGAREQAPPVAVGARGPVEQPVEVQPPAGRIQAAALEGRDQVDANVEPEQRLGDERAGALEGGPPHAGADPPRALWLAGMLRAALADGRRRHALGTDRTAALGARDERLAVRMSIAVSHGSA